MFNVYQPEEHGKRRENKLTRGKLTDSGKIMSIMLLCFNTKQNFCVPLTKDDSFKNIFNNFFNKKKGLTETIF